MWLDRFGYVDPMTGELTGKVWTRELIVARLISFARKHGRAPYPRELRRASPGRKGPGPRQAKMPSHCILVREFGSYAAAIEAAGLDHPSRARPYARKVRCAECGKTFTARQSTATYCNRNCEHSAKLARQWAERGAVLKRCACGCKRHVAPGRRFIRGHQP